MKRIVSNFPSVLDVATAIFSPSCDRQTLILDPDAPILMTFVHRKPFCPSSCQTRISSKDTDINLLTSFASQITRSMLVLWPCNLRLCLEFVNQTMRLMVLQVAILRPSHDHAADVILSECPRYSSVVRPENGLVIIPENLKKINRYLE